MAFWDVEYKPNQSNSNDCLGSNAVTEDGFISIAHFPVFCCVLLVARHFLSRYPEIEHMVGRVHAFPGDINTK